MDDEVDDSERKNIAALSLDADFADAAGPEFIGVLPYRPDDEPGEAAAPVEHRIERDAFLAKNPAFGVGGNPVEKAFDLPAEAAAVPEGAVQVGHGAVSSWDIH